MATDTQQLIKDLRKAFSNNNGFTLVKNDGTQRQVIPHSLDLVNGTPAVEVSSVEVLGDKSIIQLSDIASIKIDSSVKVPEEVKSTQEYWQSRFFSYVVPTTSPQVQETPDTPDPILQDHSQPEQIPYPSFNNQQAEDQQPQPVSNWPVFEGTPQYASQVQHLPQAQSPQYYSSAPKQKSKTGLIIGLAVGIPVVTTIVIVSIFFSLIFGASSGYTPTGDPEVDAWEAGRDDWENSYAPDDYLTGGGEPVVLLIADTPKLTDYDHISWRGQLYSQEDAEEYGVGQDEVIPEGFELIYGETSSIPVPTVKNDSDITNTETYYYSSAQCDLILSEGILSKGKIKELGTNDDENTRALMEELVASTEDADVTNVKFYDQSGDKNNYVEAYEFTYADLSGNVVNYSIRVFTNSGKYFITANDCGLTLDEYEGSGWTPGLFLFPYYPEYEEIQKP